MLEAAQEPEVQDFELVVQLHAHDAIVSVDAQKDPRGLAVLSENHLHLKQGMANGALSLARALNE